MDGLTFVAGPLTGLLHRRIRVEGETGGARDVLGRDTARDAVFEQGAGVTHEFTGLTPQRARQSGEFRRVRHMGTALPRDHMLGTDV